VNLVWRVSMSITGPAQSVGSFRTCFAILT
jgi:hypothetical protein